MLTSAAAFLLKRWACLALKQGAMAQACARERAVCVCVWGGGCPTGRVVVVVLGVLGVLGQRQQHETVIAEVNICLMCLLPLESQAGERCGRRGGGFQPSRISNRQGTPVFGNRGDCPAWQQRAPRVTLSSSGASANSKQRAADSRYT
jgi:hypothetical protein